MNSIQKNILTEESLAPGRLSAEHQRGVREFRLGAVGEPLVAFGVLMPALLHRRGSKAMAQPGSAAHA